MRLWLFSTILFIGVLAGIDARAQNSAIAFDPNPKQIYDTRTYFSYLIRDVSPFQPGFKTVEPVELINFTLDTILFNPTHDSAIAMLHLIDSMEDARLQFKASTRTEQTRYGPTISFDPGDDTHPPVITKTFLPKDTVRCIVTDTLPWNRGIDTFVVNNLYNLKLDTVIKEGRRKWTFYFHWINIKDSIDGLLRVDPIGSAPPALSTYARLNSQPPNTPHLNLNRAFYDFGRTNVTDIKTDTIEIQNIGTNFAYINRIRISNGDSADFWTISTANFTIASGQTKSIFVNFKPDHVGPLGATIIVNYQGGADTEETASLVGTGIRRAILAANDVHTNIGVPFSFPVRLVGISDDVKFNQYTAELKFNGTVFAITSVTQGSATAAFSYPSLIRYSRDSASITSSGHDSITTLANDTLFWIHGTSYLGTAPQTAISATFSTNNDKYVDVYYTPAHIVNNDCSIATLSAIEKVRLAQPSPNPANPSTVLSFSLAEESSVDFALYSPLGEKVFSVAHGTYGAGTHSFLVDLTRFASGVYTCRLATPSTHQVKKLVVVK